MQAAEANGPQNQLLSPAMSGGKGTAAGEAGLPADPLLDTNGSHLATSVLALAAGGGALVLANYGAGAPLLLSLLSLLAAFGLFFLMAFAAGHIVVRERVAPPDVARAALDHAADGLLVTRPDGEPLLVNATMRALGVGEGPLAVGSLERIAGPDAAAQAALFRLHRAAAAGRSAAEEIVVAACSSAGVGFDAAAADTRHLRVSTRPLSVPGHERDLVDGRLVLWTATDITRERQREAACRADLESRIATFETAPIGILAAGSDASVQRMNDTLAGWLGYSGKALPARLVDLLPQGSEALVADLVRRAAAGPVAIDVDLMSEDGRILPAHLVCRSRPGDRDGGLTIAIWPTGHGAAADPAAEAGDREERLARLFEAAPFGIAVVGADGRIAGPNGAFCRLMLDATGGAGQTAVDVLCRAADIETRAAIEAGLRQVLSGRGNATAIDVAVGGSPPATPGAIDVADRRLARRVYMHPVAEGTAVLYVVDATEHKTLEAKFAQSSKMEAVGKLAGGIAHDFNNMLTAIIGFTDILLGMHRPQDLAYKDLRNIRSSAERAAGLVGKLLAFSRQQTLLKETLQLDEVLTDLALLLKRSVGEKIELKLTSGRDLWLVRADKLQLEQAIVNLAVNARDAMVKGGKLLIRTRNVGEREVQRLSHLGVAAGEYVLIEVEDTGTGMPPEVLAKIFDPFFTTKGVGKGTGLGLATVYGTVKQTGGYIFADSVVGKGTTFRIYLRRHVPDADEVSQAQKVAAAQKTQKPADLTGTGRVLLVEDEDVVRSFAVRALKSRGFEVLEAASGVEALEVMEKCGGEVDIVVSDVVMPEMDGPALLKALRAKNPDIKIIFVSGYPNEAFKQQLDENETFAFLPKPFSLPQLAAKVKEELAR